MPRRSFFIRESELSDDQRQVINRRMDNSFIVKGCAGSGKSILALWKAKQIQDEGKGTFMFVVFTKSLKQYMSDGVSQIGINSSCIENYNQCFFWKQDPDTRKWVQGEWRKGSYDYLIVDEAQDFSKEDILLFKSKARKALLLYGDSAQQLYNFIQGKTTISMDDMVYLTKFPTEQLVFNHRLPKKVARLAEFINSESDVLERRCKNEGVELPKIYQYKSFEEQLSAIIQIIKNRNFEDVGILFRHNKDVERATEYFKSHGLPNVESKINESIDLNFKSDNPKIMTYHSAKGLQFEAVFIPECTCSDNDSRNPLYVAVTRTYQTLYIMHSGNLSSFFDNVPTYLYETSTSATDEL